MTPLADFEGRLVAFRETLNREDERREDAARVFAFSYPAHRPDPTAWATTIMAAGRMYLRTGQHLRPVTIRPASSSRKYRALAVNATPPPDCGRGWSGCCQFAAESVGLFDDVLARKVAAWMDAHGVEDPAAPWRLACEVAGEQVPEPADARWRLRTGDGKVYPSLPWAEAGRMADADGPLASCSLDKVGTLVAMRARLEGPT